MTKNERIAALERAVLELDARLAAFGKELHGVNVGEGEHYAKLHARIDKVVEIIGERFAELQPAFPTGGSTTAEEAAEAVLPVPQRGDQVRLESGRTLGGSVLLDGWYDVIGHAASSFQVGSDRLGPVWVGNDNPCLKEVRHADQ